MKSDQKSFVHTAAAEKIKKVIMNGGLPSFIISDFDGSLFTPNIRIIYESILQNRIVSNILKRKNIPLVINTGRSDWNKSEKIDAQLVSIHPDIIIAGAGTKIYYREKAHQLTHDQLWNEKLAKQPFLYKGKSYVWGDKNTVTLIKSAIDEYRETTEEIIPFIPKKGHEFLVRYTVKGITNNQLIETAVSLQNIFKKGIKVIFTEHLWSRSLGTPTGDILLIPESAGKDRATDYILSSFASYFGRKMNGFCFGDGSIDLTSFLSMPVKNDYSLEQYLIHPTPLAKLLVQTFPKDHPHVRMQSGPTVIQSVVSHNLSQAQNSKLRTFVTQPTGFLIDRIYAKNLTANEISFLGLRKVIAAIDTLYILPPTKKIKALREYTLGLFADVADGTRARKTEPSTDGHLVDVFCDRVKEFYQLYIRGRDRLEKNPEEGLLTLQSALSCILPSLARAQSEIQGIIVPENATGSMWWRTQKLFYSLFRDIMLNQHNKSYMIDKEILDNSLNVYQERMKNNKNFSLGTFEIAEFSSFQKKAFERWFLLAHLIQDEYSAISVLLSPPLHIKFSQWLESFDLITLIIKTNLENDQKRYTIKTLPLRLEDYIHFPIRKI